MTEMKKGELQKLEENVIDHSTTYWLEVYYFNALKLSVIFFSLEWLLQVRVRSDMEKNREEQDCSRSEHICGPYCCFY